MEGIVDACAGESSLGEPRFRFSVVLAFAERLEARLGLGGVLSSARTFGFRPLALDEKIIRALEEAARAFRGSRLDAAHLLGTLADRLFAAASKPGHGASGERAKLGSFYTPRGISAEVTSVVFPHVLRKLELEKEDFATLDPAAGGGSFLLEAGALLLSELRRRGLREEAAERAVRRSLYGVDRDGLACAVLELALGLAFGNAPDEGPRVFHGDALLGRGFDPTRPNFEKEVDFSRCFPGRASFDWIVGNPPWVAYQGRATRPLSPELRAHYRKAYPAFSGYPTLQSLFVERTAELAPRGVVSLLLPSSLSDLDGYGGAREALTKTHETITPMVEYGQDAFESVVQPCFALVAIPREERGVGSREAWTLLEKGRARETAARELSIPGTLLRLREGPRLPPELFGELGFQTNRVATETLLHRGEKKGRFTYPLLEGKDVKEFSVGAPRVFLDPDREALARAKVRLRPERDYEKAKFIVRQTASFPIAALHTGLPFRNSLLAGYESSDYSASLLVGLLNSTLLRAYHLASRRDARQLAFPQLKVGHLRALPAPRELGREAAELASFVREITAAGRCSEAERRRLDELVFALYELAPREREEVVEFFEGRTRRSSVENESKS